MSGVAEIVVVGAGFAGLASAIRLQAAGHQVTLGLIRDIFDGHGLPPDMSLYLHAPTRTDRSLAPPGVLLSAKITSRLVQERLSPSVSASPLPRVAVAA
jgi:phytoene dehydrogenase-like protein